MKIKKCFKCGIEMPIDKFYRHPRMADGHLGKCKECTKKDIIENRANKFEYYKEYDRKRADLPKRVKARKEYYENMKGDPNFKANTYSSNNKYRKNNPDKHLAHNRIGYAVTGKKIKKPKACSVCGKECRTEGHHYDYSKPLDVVWVCHICHMKIHKELRIIERLNNN